MCGGLDLATHISGETPETACETQALPFELPFPITLKRTHRQLEQLKSVEKNLDTNGIGLIAVSRDMIGSHAKYAQKHGLAFTLASDPEYRFASAVDSLVEKKLYGRSYLGPSRSAYLISEKGVLLGLVEAVDSANHAGQALALVSSRPR